MTPRELVKKFGEDAFSNVDLLCKEFARAYGNDDTFEVFEEEALEYLALARAVFENTHLIEFNLNWPSIEDNPEQNCQKIDLLFDEIKGQLKSARMNQTVAEFSGILNDNFSYSFSDDEAERIQGLVNELRDLISKSELFESKHRDRLLRRLEKLQSEIHKSVSDLDRLWGLVGDAGVAFGKFGKDAKPIVDRIREIAQITWRAQKRAEGIEDNSSLPQLEDLGGGTA